MIDRERSPPCERASSRSSTAARGARPSWASARGARCPTASRWRGWPGSTATGRCSSPMARAAASPTSTAPPTSTSTRPTSARPAASPRPPCWRRSPSARAAGCSSCSRSRRRSRPPSCSPSATGCPPGSSRSRPRAPTRRRSGWPATAPAATVIVVFGGHYHGHLDDTLVEGDEHGARPHLLGVNPRAAADTRVVPFNDLAALERVLASGNVAAVITEPALTNAGVVLPADGFHAGVRELTRAHGTLLVLDETHTQTVRLRRADARVGPGARRDRARQEHRRRDPDRRLRDDGRPARLDGAPSRRLRRRARARHRRDDLRQPALARRHGRDAARTSRRPRRSSAPRRSARQLADGIEAAAARVGLPWRAHRLGGRSGYCLEPELPRDARDAERSLDVELIDTRRLFMANRGVWDAIAGAGPAASFAHTAADVEEYLLGAGGVPRRRGRRDRRIRRIEERDG